MSRLTPQLFIIQVQGQQPNKGVQLINLLAKTKATPKAAAKTNKTVAEMF